MKSRYLASSLMALTLVQATPAFAQGDAAYPSQMIKVGCPTDAWHHLDILARVFADRLAAR